MSFPGVATRRPVFIVSPTGWDILQKPVQREDRVRLFTAFNELSISDSLDYHRFLEAAHRAIRKSGDPALQRWRSDAGVTRSVSDLTYARLFMCPTEATCGFCPQALVACLSTDVSGIGAVLPEVL
jgi:hypothetical protein